MSERNGFRVSWVVIVGFLLALMGTGYAMLDAKKAECSDDALILTEPFFTSAQQ